MATFLSFIATSPVLPRTSGFRPHDRIDAGQTRHLALAAPDETVVKKLFFPSDRETFKQLAAQAAFDLLRRKLLA